MKLQVLVIGDSPGFVKLCDAVEGLVTIMDEELFVLICSSDKPTVDEYILSHKKGECPVCHSKNVLKDPLYGFVFWGCKDCKYGYWEKHLGMSERNSFIAKYSMIRQDSIYANYDTKYRNTKVKTQTKKKSTADAVQLTLF